MPSKFKWLLIGEAEQRQARAFIDKSKDTKARETRKRKDTIRNAWEREAKESEKANLSRHASRQGNEAKRGNSAAPRSCFTWQPLACCRKTRLAPCCAYLQTLACFTLFELLPYAHLCSSVCFVCLPYFLSLASYYIHTCTCTWKTNCFRLRLRLRSAYVFVYASMQTCAVFFFAYFLLAYSYFLHFNFCVTCFLFCFCFAWACKAAQCT